VRNLIEIHRVMYTLCWTLSTKCSRTCSGRNSVQRKTSWSNSSLQ